MIENCNWRKDGKIVELSFHTGAWGQPRMVRGLPTAEDGVAVAVASDNGDRPKKRAKRVVAPWREADTIVMWLDNRFLVSEDTLFMEEGRKAAQDWVCAMKAVGKNVPNLEICIILASPKNGMCFPAEALAVFLSETPKLKLFEMNSLWLRGKREDFAHLQSVLKNQCTCLEGMQSLNLGIPYTCSLQEKEAEVAGSLVVVPSLKRLRLDGLIITPAKAPLLSHLSRLESLQLDIVFSLDTMAMLTRVVKACSCLAKLHIGIIPQDPNLPATGELLDAFAALGRAVWGSKIISLTLSIPAALTSSSTVGNTIRQMLRNNHTCHSFSLQIFMEGINGSYAAVSPTCEAAKWNKDAQVFVRLNKTKRTRLLSLFTPELISPSAWVKLMEDLGSPESIQDEADDADSQLSEQDVLTGLYLFIRQHGGHISALPNHAQGTEVYLESLTSLSEALTKVYNRHCAERQNFARTFMGLQSGADKSVTNAMTSLAGLQQICVENELHNQARSNASTIRLITEQRGSLFEAQQSWTLSNEGSATCVEEINKGAAMLVSKRRSTRFHVAVDQNTSSKRTKLK